MNPKTKRTLIGILAGIAISLAIYFLFSPSPLALAVGCVAGVYIARPESLAQGALAGGAVAAPLGIYLAILALGTAPTPDAPRVGALAALEDLLLIIGFGGLYGFVFVWLIKRMTRGQHSTN